MSLQKLELVNHYFQSQNIIVTGGWIDHKMSALTEMSVNYGMWEIVTTASLPFPLTTAAALTINNQVYMFGNFSKPERFSLKLLNDS